MTCIEQFTFTSEKQLFVYVSVVRLSTSTGNLMKFITLTKCQAQLNICKLAGEIHQFNQRIYQINCEIIQNLSTPIGNCASAERVSLNSHAIVTERTNGLIASKQANHKTQMYLQLTLETSKSRRFSIAAAAAAAAAAADAGELNVAAAAAATAFKADGGKQVMLPMDIRGVCRECDGEGECSFFTITSECKVSVGVFTFAALAAAAAAALATRVSAKA
uniref:Uncharacterized protein n=1 Tax=Glossina brevipalpis TaxID=37001 RepID=A0A1A9X3D2_9MUSC